MFIYADESGHSGRYIFHKPQYYRQGALLCKTDPEPALDPVIGHYCRQLGVSHLHANEIPPRSVEEVARAILDVVEGEEWIFHTTIIQKPYIATTKFVDSVFDSYENFGARWLWYNHECFRHTLCCLFDDVLTDTDKRQFWDAYLKDDYAGIRHVVRHALEHLDRYAKDPRLNQVASNGLSFALQYPEQITLMASKTRKSYKGHTPNMIAFASLIQAVHSFCEGHGVVPVAFFHDPQSEFGSTMREYHRLYSSLRFSRNSDGMWPATELVDYDLGKFSLRSSKESSGLQAVDILLWLSQREHPTRPVEEAKKRLWEWTDAYHISRGMSESIVRAWLIRLSQSDLSPEDLQRGQDIVDEMENRHIEDLEDFIANQSDRRQ
jgi:hypothetical protein